MCFFRLKGRDKLQLTKIIIRSALAHFKIPFGGKQQRTYPIPPVSTVIGILKNIFNENINDFVFGYTFTSKERSFHDIQKIYKEVNLNAIKDSEKYKNNQWISDVCEIQYHVEPVLTIYTDITEEMKLSEALNLGKTDCLAKLTNIHRITLLQRESCGYNQWTDLSIGTGLIQRIATETSYNKKKGIYDIYTKTVRFNDSFVYGSNYDAEAEQNVFLWRFKKGGQIDVV